MAAYGVSRNKLGFEMLTILKKINSLNVVLASGSPRRKELLTQIGVKFRIMKSKYEEDLDKEKYSPKDYVLQTALLKAKEVIERNREQKGEKIDLLISADTVVALGKEILGKPKDSKDAFNMLKTLSNKTHDVYTGVTLILVDNDAKKDKIVQFFEKTTVFFDELSDEVIKKYVETKEPLDKAGSYGIQGIGACLIKKINGDYFNVMGFPIWNFSKHVFNIMK